MQQSKPMIGTYHQKIIEIIGNVIYEQNRQLLIEIGNEYNIPIEELHEQFLCSRQQFYDMLITFVRTSTTSK
jgi:hypothetical protein